MAHHVDEVHGHVARAAADLSVVSDAAQVVTVAHPGGNDPRLPDPLQGELDGLSADHLAESHLAVDEQIGRAHV